MSIKKDLYTQIGAYLMAALQTYDAVAAPAGILPAGLALPGLKWFDKQMGQFTNPELAYSMPLPCILMEYQQFNWYTVGKNEQRGNGTIKFYIYFENYADAFTGSVNQQLALNFFDFTEYVNLALQGFHLPNMSALDRVTDNEDSAEDMIITSMAEYGTIITDTTTDESRNFVLTNPAVNVTRVPQTSRPGRGGFTDGFVIP
jgi:hypothetical protein